MVEPPLDEDPRWCLMETVIELRRQQTGTMRLAIIDLAQAKASGKLRCMRRHLVSGKRERVSAGFWTTSRGRWIGSRLITADSMPGADDWIYYVWQPDFDGQYSPPSTAKAEPQPKPDKSKNEGWQVARVKELFLTVYSNGAPPVDAGYKEIQDDLEPECKKRGWKLPSPDSIARALGRR